MFLSQTALWRSLTSIGLVTPSLYFFPTPWDLREQGQLLSCMPALEPIYQSPLICSSCDASDGYVYGEHFSMGTVEVPAQLPVLLHWHPSSRCMQPHSWFVKYLQHGSAKLNASVGQQSLGVATLGCGCGRRVCLCMQEESVMVKDGHRWRNTQARAIFRKIRRLSFTGRMHVCRQ